MRTVLAAASAAASLMLPFTATPASAAPAALVLDCSTLFDAPNSHGTATCSATGTIDGFVFVGAAAWMDYSATPTCPTSVMYGVIYGLPFAPLNFSISRVGPIGAVAISNGSTNGNGWAEFSSQCPALIEALVMEVVGV